MVGFGTPATVDTSKGEYGHLYDGGNTALYDAIAEGMRVLGEPQQGDCVYAITDGGDNASKSTLLRTKAALLQTGVRLFVLIPPGSSPFTLEESQGVDSLIQFANDSGGMTFGDPDQRRSAFADGYREKIKAFTGVLDARVSEFWILHLPNAASNKQSKLKLEIAGAGGKIRNDLQLTYPRLLPATK